MEDLSTRARIRDAAVEVFGIDGFGASVRIVATRAGVSPGLLNHHFGSKDGLRAVCDEHVLRVIRELKEASIASGPTEMLAQLAAVEEYAPLVAYVVASLQTGGDLATAFLEQMIDDVQAYLADAVAAGAVRPSRDPAARARFLVMAGVGMLLVHLRLYPASDLAASMTALTGMATLPALELYSEGLFTDRSMLDGYLMYVPDPPDAPRA